MIQSCKKELVVVLCAAIAVIISCTTKKDRLVTDTLTIAITPQTVSISTGTSISLTAVCKSGSASSVVTANIAPNWTVDSPSLGTFKPAQGKTTTFTATSATSAVGKGRIYAAYSNIKASAGVSVSSSIFNSPVSTSAANIGSITISPSNIVLNTDGMQVFTASCLDTSGHALNVSPQWMAIPSTLGTFSAMQGSTVTFIATTNNANVGSGIIKAGYYGVSGSASVFVTSATAALTITVSPSSVSISTGATQPCTAVCRDSGGNIVSDSPQWMVLPSSLGTFNPTSGSPVTFTAASSVMAVGNGTIYATYSSYSGSASVAVSSNAIGGTAGSGSLLIFSDAGLGSNITLQEWNIGSSITLLSDGDGALPDSQKYYRILWGGSGWDVWAFHSTANISLSAHTNLCFYVKGVTGTEDVTVGILDSSANKTELPLSSLGYTITTNWQLVQIPLSDFTSVNMGSVMTPVYFLFNIGTAETIYIDYIYFQ